MKASIITTATALFATALAAPLTARQTDAPLYFTVSLANDISGASDARTVTVNAGPIRLGDLFGWAPALLQNGRLFATSAQNVNPNVGAFCVFKDPATGTVFPLNDQVTFVDLDGEVAAVPEDVTDFTFECEK